MNYSLDTLLYGMQFRRLMEKEMAPIETTYGLQKIDMQILLYLKHADEQNTSKDIMQMNMFTRGHISQSLSRLHRRCTHNYLTEDSQIIIVKIEEIYRKIKDIVLDGVTEEEKKTLAVVAQKMNHNISKFL